MILPTFKKERKLWKMGIENVIGIDEAGRGCWAGPVVAGATKIKYEKPLRFYSGQAKIKNKSILKYIRDSKLLGVKKRERVYDFLIDCGWLEWAIGIVEAREIDELGLGEANRLAMRRAVEDLMDGSVRESENECEKSVQSNEKIEKLSPPTEDHPLGENKEIEKQRDANVVDNADKKIKSRCFVPKTFLLIDAVKLPEYKDNSESVIKGDVTVFSIACASIIAKVTRDRMMRQLAQEYPYWGFDRHKGYGTAFHREMISRYGVCEIHRKSFKPIKRLLIANNC